MKKVNIPVRLKNPWFWVGVVSVAIASIGLDASTLTSWEAVAAAALDVLRNPVQVVTLALAVLAIFIDPTTAGIGDSANALEYTEPKKDGEE